MTERIAQAHPITVACIFLGGLALAFLALYVFPVPIGMAIAVLVTVFELLLFGWLLAIGLYFNSRLASNIARNTTAPKAAFVFALAYCSISFVVFDPTTEPSLRLSLLPLHLLAMIANFYMLWFGTRSLKSFELGRAASFYDLSGPFFLIWLLSLPLPIGPLLVQARARTLAATMPAA